MATGLIYAAAGVPRPAVWGAVTGIRAMLPVVSVLVGSIGGFQVLGPIGVFMGPVVAALCGEMWREWTRGPAAPRSPDSDRRGTFR